MDHDPGIRQCSTFSGSTGRKQDRSHTGRLANAVGRHIAADVLHRVVDRHAGGDRTARRVDVEVDVRLGVVELQEQQLSHDAVSHVIVDAAAEDHNAIFQQPAVDVHSAFITPVLFDDIGDKDCHVRIHPAN